MFTAWTPSAFSMLPASRAVPLAGSTFGKKMRRSVGTMTCAFLPVYSQHICVMLVTTIMSFGPTPVRGQFPDLYAHPVLWSADIPWAAPIEGGFLANGDTAFIWSSGLDKLWRVEPDAVRSVPVPSPITRIVAAMSVGQALTVVGPDGTVWTWEEERSQWTSGLYLHIPVGEELVAAAYHGIWLWATWNGVDQNLRIWRAPMRPIVIASLAAAPQIRTAWPVVGGFCSGSSGDPLFSLRVPPFDVVVLADDAHGIPALPHDLPPDELWLASVACRGDGGLVRTFLSLTGGSSRLVRVAPDGTESAVSHFESPLSLLDIRDLGRRMLFASADGVAQRVTVVGW